MEDALCRLRPQFGPARVTPKSNMEALRDNIRQPDVETLQKTKMQIFYDTCYHLLVQPHYEDHQFQDISDPRLNPSPEISYEPEEEEDKRKKRMYMLPAHHDDTTAYHIKNQESSSGGFFQPLKIFWAQKRKAWNDLKARLVKPDMESGSTEPLYKLWISQKWHGMKGLLRFNALSVVFLIVCVYALIQVTGFSYQEYRAQRLPIYVDSQKRKITDPLRVDQVALIDLEGSRAWLAQYAKLRENGPFSEEGVRSGYFTTDVYGYGRKNVSLEILREAMKIVCPADRCMCVSAYQLGIPRNIALLNARQQTATIFMIDPFVDYVSTETFKVRIRVVNEEEVSVDMPTSCVTEHKTLSATKERNTFEMNESACIMRIIQIADSLIIKPRSS